MPPVPAVPRLPTDSVPSGGRGHPESGGRTWFISAALWSPPTRGAEGQTRTREPGQLWTWGSAGPAALPRLSCPLPSADTPGIVRAQVSMTGSHAPRTGPGAHSSSGPSFSDVAGSHCPDGDNRAAMLCSWGALRIPPGLPTSILSHETRPRSTPAPGVCSSGKSSQGRRRGVKGEAKAREGGAEGQEQPTQGAVCSQPPLGSAAKEPEGKQSCALGMQRGSRKQRQTRGCGSHSRPAGRSPGPSLGKPWGCGGCARTSRRGPTLSFRVTVLMCPAGPLHKLLAELRGQRSQQPALPCQVPAERCPSSLLFRRPHTRQRAGGGSWRGELPPCTRRAGGV